MKSANVADPILEARELTKRYRRGVTALAGIDLELPAGGITALVGPNAAGKSTLIRTWVGFEKPTRGSAQVMGLDPWRQRSAALARIGYIPQSPSLYDSLSVDDHLGPFPDELAVTTRRQSFRPRAPIGMPVESVQPRRREPQSRQAP